MELPSSIINYLNNADLALPSVGLTNGRLGISMLSIWALSNGASDKLSPRQRDAVDFLGNALSDYYSWPTDFMHGSLALPWCIKRLVNCGIMAEPKQLKELFADCLWRYRSYFMNSPFQYNPNDRLWPVGFVTLALCSKEDDILRYAWEEQTIHRIRDCERLLTESVPGLYKPQSLTAGVLHSMLYFLRQAHKMNIFPAKCAALVAVIAQLDYDVANSNPVDVIILDLLMGREIEPERVSNGMLSDLGLFAFIYNRSQLFPLQIAKRLCSQLPVEDLIGVAFGFYSYEQDESS